MNKSQAKGPCFGKRWAANQFGETAPGLDLFANKFGNFPKFIL
ncbi:hypothetical protein HMPREF9103_00975 [Lentilactobacillus parafarraginis F0439]|uniref:Uncharacterized protein n=1 Tax=Lentilactobacillus parafarraginis F0439 TaxID=797515 RepID=G9ZMM5_9LACO|nr:hypothetical protein HMPREF9103_00975 [Lentilactobacillus parafarraginis F0439]